MDPEVCSTEGVTYDQLVGEDTGITRALAQRTSAKGAVIGLRAPSAAMQGAITFVIFGQLAKRLPGLHPQNTDPHSERS